MTRSLVFVLSVLITLSSCVKEESPTGTEMESRSLRAWIKKNHPNLLDNHQSNGDYYVDVLAWGEESDQGDDNDYGDKPVMDQDSVWMFYNMTGYDLEGNVCINRNEMIARMQGVFDVKTHYVPYMNYSGDVNAIGLLESTYLAARNEITLGDKYVADHTDICKGTTFKLRRGSKIRIYAPSTIAYGSSGTSSSDGYGGQYSLDGNVPMIMDIEVVRAVKNPATLEVDMIQNIVGAPDNVSDGLNGWTLAVLTGTANETTTDDSSDETSDDSDKLKGLYYNLEYEPGVNNVGLKYLQQGVSDMSVSSPYKDSGKYADMAALDEKINSILAEKFSGKVLAKEDMTDDNLITKEGSTSIWYVVRFLDGFVLDTNIDEIRELVFDDTSTSSSAISYTPDGTSDDMISAWLYCIPKMHYGQWAAILTPSGFAYGTTGTSSTTTTSSTAYSYSTYYDYYNSYNSMYYSDYYYNYYGYSSYISSSSSTDTSSIETEIMGYTPLLFYVYIEPED